MTEPEVPPVLYSHSLGPIKVAAMWHAGPRKPER